MPDRVAEIRQEIAEAVVGCRYRRPEALARANGKQFRFTFGDVDDPARYWRTQEETGGEPMKYHVGMLDRPYRTASAGSLYFVAGD